MSKKIPRGEDHLNCPLWQKPMSEVCHKCPWWVEVKGKDPQTGEDASDWNCAISWGPMLAINIAQQARQTGAAVESFRNQMAVMSVPSAPINQKLPQGPKRILIDSQVDEG